MITYLLFQLMRSFVLFILWYVVLMSGISILQMISGLIITPAYISRTRNFENRLMGSSVNMVPISVLTPAFNEEAVIVDSIKSMLNVNYTNYEVIVINDGSTDNTLNEVINAFNLHKITYPIRERLAAKKVKAVYYNPDIPRLRVIDKENGGKSDALNAGINLSRYPYITSLEVNSLLDADALLRIAMAFMQNKYTVAVGGTLRVANGCTVENGKILSTGLPREFLPLLQLVEYFRFFFVGRIGWNGLNSLLTISGGFGAFQKEAVLQVGGYTTGTVGEDMDLVIKLHRYMRSKKFRYRVSLLPDLFCWTQAPESFRDLHTQRIRWQIGLIDVINRHRIMFLNPKFGTLGMLTMPHYFLFEMVSPIVETLGYILVPLAFYFGFLSLDALILFFAAIFAFGMVSSAGSLIIDEFTHTGQQTKIRDVLLLGLVCIAENLFFRHLTVFFRLAGILSYRRWKKSAI